MSPAILWFRYVVVALACVYLLTESVLFAGYREQMHRTGPVFTVLAYCRACTGFWVGVGLGVLRMVPWQEVTFFDSVLLSGCFVMMLGYVWSALHGNDAFIVERATNVRELAVSKPHDPAPDEPTDSAS